MRSWQTAALVVVLLAPLDGGAAGSASSLRGLGLQFRQPELPASMVFSYVRVVISCGHVEAITYIPPDWYVGTLRPPLSSSPHYQEFQFASEAVEFLAGHGASRMDDLSKFNGAVRVSVLDASCFDLTVLVGDDLGEEVPERRFNRAQLRLVE
jgi:hypothetical protein